jgi:hypothetical protein
MRKNLIIILIILISILNVGCIDYNNNSDNNEKKDKYQCSYWYQIEINGSSQHYNINVPIPVFNDDNRVIHISPIIDDLKLAQGNASFEIENTSHGPSLKIIGRGYTVINISGNDLSKYQIHNKNTNLFLSMAKDENNDSYYDDEYDENEYFIFCFQNLSLNIKVILSYSHHSQKMQGMLGDNIIQGQIKQGWNKVKGEFNIAA